MKHLACSRLSPTGDTAPISYGDVVQIVKEKDGSGYSCEGVVTEAGVISDSKKDVTGSAPPRMFYVAQQLEILAIITSFGCTGCQFLAVPLLAVPVLVNSSCLREC